MRRGVDVFANDLVYGREIEQQKLKHRKHVASVKPTSQTNARDRELDQRVPKTLSPRYDHIRFNAKRIEIESEWYHRVNHQNRVLLERMIKISQTHSQMPKTPPRFHDHHEHNDRMRRRRLNKVYQENVALSRRIRDIQPSYPNKEWDRMHAHQNKLRKKLSRDRTIGYLSSAPKHPPGRRHRRQHVPQARTKLCQPNQAWRSPRAAAAKAGLYVDLDSVPGGHLWGGPSIQSTRGNWKKRQRQPSQQTKRLAKQAEARWNEQQWDTSTSLHNPKAGSYEAVYKKANRMFDITGYVPYGAATSKGFRAEKRTSKPSLGRKRRRKARDGSKPFDGGRQSNKKPLPVEPLHEELLFQGRKKVDKKSATFGSETVSLSHVAIISVFERTEQVFRQESIPSLNPGGSSLSIPSFSDAPIQIHVATRSLGLRVVAHLIPTSEDERTDLQAEPGGGIDADYDSVPSHIEEGVVVAQFIGLHYLRVLFNNLAKNGSDDQESQELSHVANLVLQKLRDHSNDVGSVDMSLREGLVDKNFDSGNSGILLQRFAQLLMHICDTELYEPSLTAASSNLVVGRQHSPALHAYATSIQAVVRGLVSRIRVYKMLKRVQRAESHLVEKEIQRQMVGKEFAPEKNKSGTMKASTEASPKQNFNSRKPSQPPKRKFVRPTNRPGRGRPAVTTHDKRNFKVPSRPAGKRPTEKNGQQSLPPTRSKESQKHTGSVHEESTSVSCLKTGEKHKRKEESSSIVAGRSAPEVSPKQGFSPIKDSDNKTVSPSEPKWSDPGTVDDKVLHDDASLLEELESMILEQDESMQKTGISSTPESKHTLPVGAEDSLLAELDSMILEDENLPSFDSSGRLMRKNSRLSVHSQISVLLLSELDDIIIDKENNLATKSTQHVSSTSSVSEDASLLAELDSMISESEQQGSLHMDAIAPVNPEASATLLAELDSIILEEEESPKVTSTKFASEPFYTAEDESKLLAELDQLEHEAANK